MGRGAGNPRPPPPLPFSPRPRAPRWGHVQAADERDEVVGGDAPLGPRATELQDLHEGPEDA